MQDDVNVMDLVIAMGACTNSGYGEQYQIPGSFAPIADYGLLERAVRAASDRNLFSMISSRKSKHIPDCVKTDRLL